MADLMASGTSGRRCSGVSIAMATFNGERFLREQLESLKRQTRLPGELLVCDDGSSDRTVEILEEYAPTVPFPVRIYENASRLGYRDNFLRASALCSHDVIAFCDQDDVWNERKLELCVAAMERTGAVLVIHDADVVGPDLKFIHPLQQIVQDGRTYDPLETWPMPGSALGFTMLFQRRLLSALPVVDRPYEPGREAEGVRLAHDTWVLLLASFLGRITHVDSALVQYRQHGSNTVGASSSPPTFPAEILVSHYSQRIILADQVVRMLRGHELAGFEQALGRRAVSAYGRRSDALKKRIDLYRSHTRLARGFLLLAMMWGRHYGSSRKGGLGPRSLLKDIFATVRRP